MSACAAPPDEAAFLEWEKETAIPVDQPERLDPLLAGKSIVFLGEPDHFIHEKNEYRTGRSHQGVRGTRPDHADVIYFVDRVTEPVSGGDLGFMIRSVGGADGT